jgi:hypothetical protein
LVFKLIHFKEEEAMKQATVIIAVILVIICISSSFAKAQSITKPFTFQAGQPAKANEVNTNFDVLYNKVNEIDQYVTKPIIWSGGCANPQSTCVSELGRYIYCSSCCTDRVDFDKMQSYLQTTNEGIFTVLVSGLYRIHASFAAAVNINANLFVNDISVESHSGGQCLNYGGNVQCVKSELNLDIIWPFNVGDTFYIYYSSGYYYDPGSWPNFRLQISYVGQN